MTIALQLNCGTAFQMCIYVDFFMCDFVVSKRVKENTELYSGWLNCFSYYLAK